MKETKKDNKKQLSFSVCAGKPAREIPVLIEKKTTKGWMMYGLDNNYPEYLWNLYLRSALLQSIINGTSDYVLGDGVVSPRLAEDKIVNKDDETIDDIVKQLTIDYLIFDGFALQLLFDKVGDIAEMYWLDFRKCRVSDDEKIIYYSDEWEKSSPKYIEYERFDGSERRGSKVLYFKGHKTRGVYPIPRYSGALNALETSTEIARYHLNAIHNNFNGNLIVNFNNGEPDDETKKDIERKVKNKFAGAENGGSFLISFNDSKENGVSVERIQDDNTDKKYEQLRKDTYKEIFIAFRCQPQLFGFLIEGSLFNKEEYAQAYQLYYKTVVMPIQNDIIRCFNKVYDSKENVIDFIPFKINDNQDESVSNQ